MTRISFALALSLALSLPLAGCMNEPAPAVGFRSATIINGARERALPEVVAVVQVSGGSILGLCSGTVIAANRVITAKHCVFTDTGGASETPISPSSMRVMVTHDIFGTIDVTARVTAIAYPGGDTLTDADLNEGRDIAVLTLDRSLPVTPRELARAMPNVGNPVTIVGFGRTRVSSESSGRKYLGTALVAGSYAGNNLFETAGISRTCQGDSGGPAFDANGRLLGVTSFGVDRSCATDRSFFTALAGQVAFVEGVLGAAAPCTARAETCNGADDNCDRTTDEGCGPLGEECSPATPEACSTGRCENIGGTFRCVSGCDPDASNACPEGFICEVQGCTGGRCVPGSWGTTPNGMPCSGNFDCASNYCWGLGDGTSVCAQFCRESGAPCADGFACELGGAACGACLATTEPPLAPFGDPCAADEDCQSGLCAVGAGDFCTEACVDDAGCPADYACLEGACAERTLPPPGTLELGEACLNNGECRSGICAGACTELCESDAECPAGFACEPAGALSGCFAESGGSDAGGCSVSTAARPAGRPEAPLTLLLGLLAAALALGLRRRR